LTVESTSPATRKQLRKLERSSAKEAGRSSLRVFMTFVSTTGLMATVALPSYGFSPEITAVAGLTVDNEMVQISAPSQGLAVATVRAVEFSRGNYEPADAADFAEQPRASRYNGPLAEDYLARPRFTEITSSNIMQAAAELVGTPYVHGGRTPAGIDCSGYTLFIYAQFGIYLPHSVYQQAKLGKKIPLSEAVPGDLVIFNDFSHNGIYAGGGNFYHAPQKGDRVKLASIFTDRYHIIRVANIANY
jgi:cell wall-associated NlpC family hydrolase